MSNYKFMFVCALVIVLGIMVAQTQQEGIRFGVDTGFQGSVVCSAKKRPTTDEIIGTPGLMDRLALRIDRLLEKKILSSSIPTINLGISMFTPYTNLKTMIRLMFNNMRVYLKSLGKKKK